MSRPIRVGHMVYPLYISGNVMNGPIGKQMVDTLVESSANFEMILKFFDIFLKMKDMTSSEAFLVIYLTFPSLSFSELFQDLPLLVPQRLTNSHKDWIQTKSVPL